jgi:putative endonuclease
MRIIARNVRSRTGEIDLIALDQGTLIFVEVKTWSAYGMEDLALGIGPKKRRRRIETAKYFLAAHREYNGMALRFDVIFIRPGTGPDAITHFASAFAECL